MAGPEKLRLPDAKPDGTAFTRAEMEGILRDSGTHQKRLYAISELGLPSKIAYSMKTITLLHWILDQLIRHKRVYGELMGVSSDPEADTDPDKFNQFTQRLALFIENGWAHQPLQGEGIDMSKLTPPPPPQIPQGNGVQAPQQQYAPPPPPGVPPAAPGGYAPPPQYAAPGMPPGAPPTPPGVPQAAPAPQMAPQAVPQQQYAPQPQQQQYAPPAPPPQHVPQAAPPAPQMAPQAAPQGGPGPMPTKADPNRAWGSPSLKADGTPKKRRNKAEMAEDEAYEAWVAAGGQAQQQAPQQAPAPTMPTPPPNPLQHAAPQMPMAAPAPAAGSDLTELLDNQRAILAKLSLLDTGVAQLVRVQYQRQGPANLESVLQELGLLNP